MWSFAISRPELLEISSAKERMKYMVCDRHFDENCKFPSNRNRTNLKAEAVPTLYLPEKVDADGREEIDVHVEIEDGSCEGMYSHILTLMYLKYRCCLLFIS